ncbi:hypothetical protein ACLKMY_00375 [Paraburkholderia mimosarum]|uniref:hypothetical protein n=1 Tax=Paraburkholderia mimosarum TaxID=312026 RepID=UPI0039C29608
MNDLIKPVSVGLLFVFLAVCDYLKLNDPMLREAAFGMIGIITGWHGVLSLPFSFSKPTVSTNVTVSAPAAPAPAAPVAPAQQ